jgi:transcriptional regulator with XRE-family HTH domain
VEINAIIDCIMGVREDKLREMGERLRRERISRNDTQSMFAARIGVSVPTLRKMEAGNSTVLIDSWVKSLEILDRLGQMDGLLAEPENLFEKYERKNDPHRQRASRRVS